MPDWTRLEKLTEPDDTVSTFPRQSSVNHNGSLWQSRDQQEKGLGHEGAVPYIQCKAAAKQ